MDLLGVGPLELIFILLIVFLVLGPDDLEATGRKVGRFLSSVRKSEFWRGVTQVSKEMRNLPTTLMREAELEDAKREIEKDFKDIKQISKEFGQGELKEVTREVQAALDEDDHQIAPPAAQKAAESAAETEQLEAENTEEQEEDHTDA